MDSGKSPLAMLAKTCETIGLPYASNRKANKDDKCKDETSPSSSGSGGSFSNGSSVEGKKDELSATSSMLTKKKEGSKSPRHAVHSPATAKNNSTPVMSEPSTSAAAAASTLHATNPMITARGCFPMAFPPLAAGFPAFPYPSMMPGFPAISSFAGAFPTAGNPNPFLRCLDPLSCKGCPATVMAARPCVTPGCNSCTMHGTSSNPAEMMMAFSPSFFAAYSPLINTAMPPTSSSAAQIAYQNLMAAASGQTTKHICNWIESPNGVCGKSFSTADELETHMKIVHAPSIANSNSSNASQELNSSSPRTVTTSAPLINHASLRYHPYMKPGGMVPTVPNPLGVPPFPSMPGFPSAAALHAMYTQRLMATMPHP